MIINTGQKTTIYGFGLSIKSIIVSVLGLALIILAQHFFYEPLWNFTLSSKGISHLQAKYRQMPHFVSEITILYSSLGGGNELMVLCIITFFFGRRPKFFYYMLAFTLEKGQNSLLKIYYHQPRPYMASSTIEAMQCQGSFGNPSGHSSSSCLTALMLFLDIFHGSEKVLHEALIKSQVYQLKSKMVEKTYG